MGTLYLDHQQMILKVQGAALVLENAESKPRSIPLSLLERVVANGEVALTTGVLGKLAEAGIGVLTLSARQSWRTAILLGRPHRDLRIRLAQYEVALDPTARAAWAAVWARGKTHQQLRTLHLAQAARADLARPLEGALQRLRAIAAKLADPAPGLETIRGFEGAAASAYFPALAQLFAPALGFQGRNRRPPRDPVNAALSLAYTLLHFEAVRAAQAAGLDPQIGSLHDPAYGRESLACDLIEPLRPRVDAWIWRCFQSRLLRLEHFTTDKGACLLHKAGRRHFYEAWEDEARQFRLPLRGYCRLFVAALRRQPLALAPVAPNWDEYALMPEPEGSAPFEDDAPLEDLPSVLVPDDAAPDTPAPLAPVPAPASPIPAAPGEDLQP